MIKQVGKKVSRDIYDLKKTSNYIILINSYRTLHCATAEYTFFSNRFGMLSKIDLVNLKGFIEYNLYSVTPIELETNNKIPK